MGEREAMLGQAVYRILLGGKEGNGVLRCLHRGLEWRQGEESDLPVSMDQSHMDLFLT